MRAGRKQTKVYENLYNALDYCIRYCDGQDDCLECMFKDIRIDKSTECPIYVVTELKSAVEDKIKDGDDGIKWNELEIESLQRNIHGSILAMSNLHYQIHSPQVGVT